MMLGVRKQSCVALGKMMIARTKAKIVTATLTVTRVVTTAAAIFNLSAATD